MKYILGTALTGLAIFAGCGGTGNDNSTQADKPEHKYNAYSLTIRHRVERDIDSQMKAKVYKIAARFGGTVDSTHTGCAPQDKHSFTCDAQVDFSDTEGGATCSATITGHFTGTVDPNTGDYEFHNLSNDTTPPDCY